MLYADAHYTIAKIYRGYIMGIPEMKIDTSNGFFEELIIPEMTDEEHRIFIKYIHSHVGIMDLLKSYASRESFNLWILIVTNKIRDGIISEDQLQSNVRKIEKVDGLISDKGVHHANN